MTTTDGSRSDHLTVEELAAYLDGNVSPEEIVRIQEHLDECGICREETADVVTVLQRAKRRRARRLAVPIAAAAAVAGLMLVGPSLQDRGERAGERGRGPDPTSRAETLLEIQAISPAPQATVRGDSLGFAWEAVEEGAVYRLTVTDESGELLWFHETPVTSVRLPPEVELRPGQRYFWFVDVLRADGSTGTTGVMTFSVEEEGEARSTS